MSSPTPALPHTFPDRVFRELLQEPHNLEEVVADLLPAQAALLDFSRMTPVERRYLVADWRERESDLFFRVPLREAGPDSGPIVAVLLEHQTSPDHVTPLRMLVAAGAFWEREWHEWEDSHERGQRLRLTPIVPILFHTGATPWESGRTLAELVAAGPGFAGFTPTWPAQFFGVSQRTVESLLASPGAFLPSLGVVRAEREEMEKFAQVFRAVVLRLEESREQAPARHGGLLHLVLNWALWRRPPGERARWREEVRGLPVPAHRRQEIETMSETLGLTWEQEYQQLERRIQQAEQQRQQADQLRQQADQLRQQADQQRQQAEQQLREERVQRELQSQEAARIARVESLRGSVRGVLETRFGPLPDALTQRLQQVNDPAALQAALLRAVQISTLEELLL